jgi:hypothetical protein
MCHGFLQSPNPENKTDEEVYAIHQKWRRMYFFDGNGKARPELVKMQDEIAQLRTESFIFFENLFHYGKDSRIANCPTYGFLPMSDSPSQQPAQRGGVVRRKKTSVLKKRRYPSLILDAKSPSSPPLKKMSLVEFARCKLPHTCTCTAKYCL